MGETWLKIKAWTKGILFGAVVIYIALFVFKNGGHEFHLWWWFGYSHEFDVLFLALVCFVAGGLSSLLLGTTLRTVRQIREVRATRRIDRLERENADVRAKAAMLQSGQAVTPAVSLRTDTD